MVKFSHRCGQLCGSRNDEINHWASTEEIFHTIDS